MKLRIRGNFIRLRLTPAEIARLRDAGKVEETVEFGRSSFVYTLETAETESARASFDASRLLVSIPRRQASAWADSDEVGIETVQPNGSEKGLRILIEKDFACRHKETSEKI